ncbi:MAG: hypothetical protein IT208_13305 [Chthonomonadales bacterium]|nr:hypothetical protein [Chthonomonadales bacterium]
MKPALLAVCLLSALAFPAGAAPPLLGLAANPREGATGAAFLEGVLDARRLGVSMMFSTHRWSDLEPKPGEYDLKPLREAISGLGSLGFRVALTLQTIDTNNRTLPADLASRPFDDPELIARFDRLLERVAKTLTDRVGWVMLANEADIYLGMHPEELPRFAAFAEHGRATLRRLRPGLPVGVTCTHDGVRDRPALVGRLNRDMDVVTLTYYPLDERMGVRPVAEAPADFERMVRAAGTRPLLLQEIGYPASPLLGSSEERQAAFIDAVFDAVDRHRGRIACFSFFLLHDFGDRLTDTLVGYYGIPDPRFRAFLATLGLRKADGTPRKAWARFQARAKAWGAESPAVPAR